MHFYRPQYNYVSCVFVWAPAPLTIFEAFRVLKVLSKSILNWSAFGLILWKCHLEQFGTNKFSPKKFLFAGLKPRTQFKYTLSFPCFNNVIVVRINFFTFWMHRYAFIYLYLLPYLPIPIHIPHSYTYTYYRTYLFL